MGAGAGIDPATFQSAVRLSTIVPIRLIVKEYRFGWTNVSGPLESLLEDAQVFSGSHGNPCCQNEAWSRLDPPIQMADKDGGSWA